MTEAFYDNLAPYYKYIYPDWDKSIQRQAKELDSVIREYFGTDPLSILDVSCGIGTQSIGLAAIGYEVTASDISSIEIDHAQLEAVRHGVQIKFTVADMRQVWEIHKKQFDIVVACDNSIPHLLSNDEILAAFRQFHKCTKPQGGCIISVRDYAQFEVKDGQKMMYPRLVHLTDEGQIAIFDVWDISGDYYEITTYVVEDSGKPNASTQVIRGGKYYCVQILTLENLLLDAGFRSINLLRDRFFQPILVAKK